MSGLIVFLTIVAGLLAMVGLMVWKVLKAPIPPSPPQAEQEPAPETEPPEPVYPVQVPRKEPTTRRSQRVLPRQARKSRETDGASPLKTGLDVAELGVSAVSALQGKVTVNLGTILAVGHLAAAGWKRMHPRPRMRGGDDDLGWKPGSTMGKPKEVPTLSVNVLASGQVIVEGREATLEQLDAQLTDLKRHGGKVRYYCEPCDPKPPQAVEVISRLTAKGVPFTSSS